ncbi:4436_t:CDS:2, partial [Entrophospora sp. SA101]
TNQRITNDYEDSTPVLTSNDNDNNNHLIPAPSLLNSIIVDPNDLSSSLFKNIFENINNFENEFFENLGNNLADGDGDGNGFTTIEITVVGLDDDDNSGGGIINLEKFFKIDSSKVDNKPQKHDSLSLLPLLKPLALTIMLAILLVTEISLDDLPESGDIWEMSQDPESAKSDTLKELGADSASTVTPEKLVEDFQSENIDKDSGHQTSAVVEESDDASDVDISQIFQPIYINKKLFYFGPRVFYPHRYFIPKYYYRHRFYKICTIRCKYAVIPYFM